MYNENEAESVGRQNKINILFYKAPVPELQWMGDIKVAQIF